MPESPAPLSAAPDVMMPGEVWRRTMETIDALNVEIAALRTERDQLREALVPVRVLLEVHEIWNESDWANEHEAAVLESLAWKWFLAALARETEGEQG